MQELQINYLNCPLCAGMTVFHCSASTTSYPTWHEGLPKVIEWMKCQRCGHVHTRGYWTPAGLHQVFHKTHSNQVIGGNTIPQDVKRAQWLPVVKNAVRHIGGYAALLRENHYWCDVGCGDGALLMTAHDFGFCAIGLDARKETVAQIHKEGFQAYEIDFMQARFDKPLQVISMMDVLEHIAFPINALKKVYDILAPNGLLILSLPDASCSSWKIMDRKKQNPYWIEIEHHHNFTRSRLTQLLTDQGFEIVDFDIPNRYKAQMEIYAKKRPL